MTLAEVAQRVGVSVASVRSAELRDEAGDMTRNSRAKYLRAMGLTDAVLTVSDDPHQVEALWDDTMRGVESVGQSMAFEGQPVSASDLEQIAVHSFGRRVGALG